MSLEDKISEVEVFLEVRGIPGRKAPIPDRVSKEIFLGCPKVHEQLADLSTSMIEHTNSPKSVGEFYVIPLDKPGKDPMLYSAP